MSNFKIGEKVVCVEPLYDLIKGNIYTIKSFNTCKCGITDVEIQESKLGFKKTRCACNSLNSGNLWRQDRFRKLDHQFAEDLCAQLIEEFQTETVYN